MMTNQENNNSAADDVFKHAAEAAGYQQRSAWIKVKSTKSKGAERQNKWREKQGESGLGQVNVTAHQADHIALREWAKVSAQGGRVPMPGSRGTGIAGNSWRLLVLVTLIAVTCGVVAGLMLASL